MASIKGRTALVTGASSGIGKSTVELLIAEGAVVYAAARRIDKMKELEAKGARIVALDVTDEESMSNAVETILKKQTTIDILVNNAGYGSYGALEDVPLEEARRQFEVNIFGLARLIQLVLPGMRNSRYGKIVNISSIGGKIYTPFGSWYHSTKHALEGMTDSLRVELSQFGIDPIIIEPGGIKTEWGIIAAENLKKTSGSGAYAEDANKTAANMTEMYGGNQLSDPDVIARVIVKAVTANKPKTRYAAGSMSWIALFMRRWVSDRMFDRMVKIMM